MTQTPPIQARLLDLWASSAMDESYGESLSVRDHLLQSAELATQQGLPPALVAAALLHDIGWAMPGSQPHEEAAAEWLELLFGPEVAGPVRWHVAAKRYLVATKDDYFALLSPESVRTLELQGGPMSEAECAAFEQEAQFQAALALRLIDDAAKELREPSTQIDDYLGLLKTLSVN